MLVRTGKSDIHEVTCAWLVMRLGIWVEFVDGEYVLEWDDRVVETILAARVSDDAQVSLPRGLVPAIHHCFINVQNMNFEEHLSLRHALAKQSIVHHMQQCH